MASMKPVKPQGSSPAPPKIQQGAAGVAKPAAKKAVQQPQEPKKVITVAKSAPVAK